MNYFHHIVPILGMPQVPQFSARRRNLRKSGALINSGAPIIWRVSACTEFRNILKHKLMYELSEYFTALSFIASTSGYFTYLN